MNKNNDIEKLPTTLSAFLWHFVKKHIWWFAGIQFFALAWAIDSTMWPYVQKLIIDNIIKFGDDKANIFSHLSGTLIFAACLWLTVGFGFRLSGICQAKVLPKFEADIRMAMFDYVSSHSYQYFADNFAGSISNKIADIPRSSTVIVRLIMGLFVPSLIGVIMAIVIFSYLNITFAFILGGWVLVHVVICLGTSNKCSAYSEVHAESRSDLAGKIVDSLTNNINVKLFSSSLYEKKYIQRFQEYERLKHWNALWYIEKVKIVLDIVCFLGAGVLLIWYTIYSWQHEMITLGEVILILQASWNVTFMVWIAGLELPGFFKEVGICNQALALIKATHDIVDKKDAKELELSQGEIKFEGVNFAYTKNQPVFRDMNVTIESGQKIGLVGYSGSGKSTFVGIILRFFDIISGKILIDDQDNSQVTQDSIRSNIAMIPQDTTLFHRSLMDNIRYGNPEASDEEVIAASKKAYCHEFIEKMEHGYASLVGERGIKLSGGQRQRIAVARAILKDAPILILDEATSSLDSVTEKYIQESLTELMKNRTTIVIAHRLSTLSNMDRILVFNEGEIIEDGTHKSLLKKKGHYAELWNMQSGGFLPEVPE